MSRWLENTGLINVHLKPTRIGANVIGGLLLGAAFALLGYGPGTAAVALGQGSRDALFGMIGLVAGSWIYAGFSEVLKRSVEKWGDLGKVYCQTCGNCRVGLLSSFPSPYSPLDYLFCVGFFRSEHLMGSGRRTE